MTFISETGRTKKKPLSSHPLSYLLSIACPTYLSASPLSPVGTSIHWHDLVNSHVSDKLIENPLNMSKTMTESLDPRTVTHRSLSPKSGASEDSYNERFPSFDGAAPSHSLPVVSESPLETTQSIVPEYKWPARKSSQRLKDSRHSLHRPRRSVSDALNKFRTRQGSVSENAQELAEALKAPISYSLIVRVSPVATIFGN